LTIAFGFLAGMVLVSALGVVISRNVVHSALFMSGSFLGVAGFFVMLNAPALAAFQVLIYVGAVTVVILFGIMFTQRPQARRYRTIINRQFWAGLLVAAGVGLFLSYGVALGLRLAPAAWWLDLALVSAGVATLGALALMRPRWHAHDHLDGLDAGGRAPAGQRH